MGIAVTITLFFIILFIRIVVAAMAFPEVAMFLMIFYLALFDPFPLTPEQLKPFEFVYPAVEYVYENLVNIHTVYKLAILFGCALIYICLNCALHIGWFYPFKVAGIMFCIWASYAVMDTRSELDQVWKIVLTAILSVVALAVRFSVYEKIETISEASYLYFEGFLGYIPFRKKRLGVTEDESQGDDGIN